MVTLKKETAEEPALRARDAGIRTSADSPCVQARSQPVTFDSRPAAAKYCRNLGRSIRSFCREGAKHLGKRTNDAGSNVSLNGEREYLSLKVRVTNAW